jgi:hypothetical protein
VFGIWSFAVEISSIIALKAALRYMVLPMARRFRAHFIGIDVILAALLLVSCDTIPKEAEQARLASAQGIASEPPGDYFIGRRYYKIPQFKFWGYVRKPGQPWNTAKLVVFNENQKLAPDREQLNFGGDNNYEYKLWGTFSGETVYDAGSNGFYPEFILKKYELISVSPAPIFKSQVSGRARAALKTTTIEKPE